MRKITDVISKPSEALRAMVDGLIEQSKRKDFVIDMINWGSKVNGVCYGCAATCTIQKLAGVNFDSDEIGDTETRAVVLGFDRDELNNFENSIEDVRSGLVLSLFIFFDMPPKNEYDNRWYMHDDDWLSQIPVIEATIKEMQEAGY